MERRHGPVVGDTQRDGGVEILLKLAPVSWALAALAAGILVAYAVPEGEDAPLKFMALVFAGCGLLWAFPFSGRRERRGLISLFLLAFAVRVGSAVLFDSVSRSAGDPYGGSPDAWAYDQWARRLVSAWSELRGLNLHAHDAAGRWDVGFHYLLALFYALLGPSVLGGRVLAAFFGSAAVVFLFLVARRMAGETVGMIAGLLYAFWISSVAWSGYSVLRDPLVWALMLLAVWLSLRVVDGSMLSALGFFLVLLFLRTVRPYAATVVVIGLGLAGALALLGRSRRALRPAILLATAVAATEAVFFVVGFPNAVNMVTAYGPKQVLLRPLKAPPGSRPSPLSLGPLAAPDEEDRVGVGLLSRPLLGPSIPANALRFFLSPPAWAPVRGNIRHSDNWQLPGMWFWYAILPIAGFGLLKALAGSASLRSLTLAGGLFISLLILVGRGDLSRQREMVVPVVLLWFAVGFLPALKRPRLLLVAYVLYAAVLSAGILYHRGTLRVRGLAVVVLPEGDIASSGPGRRSITAS